MNESEALREFAFKNLKLLTSTDSRVFFDIKKSKSDYFLVELKGKFGPAHNQDIAKVAVGLLVEIGKIKEQNAEEVLKQCPFLDKYFLRRDLAELLGSQATQSSIIDVQDIRSLSKKEYIRKIEEELLENARKQIEDEKEEALNKLNEDFVEKLQEDYKYLDQQRKQIEFERAEIDKLKSKIEDYNLQEIDKLYPPIKQLPQKELEQPEIEWWQKIGLFQNPFPATDGLSLIDPKYYDSIILLTQIFQTYKDLINQNTDSFLNKTYIILGEYGCGKTTLFDYLSKPLLTNGIFPIHLLLDAEPETDKIKRLFFKTIIAEISKKYLELFQVDPRTTYTEFGRLEVYEILKRILDVSSQFKGFTIFIDGLHKEGPYFNQVKEFIQSLQNTKDYFTRNNLPISIFISGSKRWQFDLKSSPSVGGSIHKMELFQEITPQDALNMVNNRLAAFSIDQNNPTKTNLGSINKIYATLKNTLTRDITFRDVIEEISPRLETSDEGTVVVAMKFDRLLLEKIKAEIDSNSEFTSKIKKIGLLTNGRDDILQKAMDTLSKIYNYKGVNEDDDFFETHKSDFALLSQAGLILKTKFENMQLKWIPDKSFMQIAFELKKQYKINLPDLLFEVLTVDKYQSTKKTETKSENTEILEKLANEYGETIPNFSKSLRKAANFHIKLMEHLYSADDIIPPNEIVSKTNESLLQIIDALILITERKGLNVENMEQARKLMSDSWIDLPEVFECWDHIDFLEKEKIVLDSKKSAEIAVSYKRAFLSVQNKIMKFAKCNSYLDISSPNLNNEDKRNLNQARELFYDQKLASCARIIADYSENRLRSFIYSILIIKFGDKWKKRLGENINKYIYDEKNKSKTKVIAEVDTLNELFFCTRSHYREIITEVPGNWEIIFESCFLPENKYWVNEALALISAISDKDKHNYDESFFKKNSEKLLQSLLKLKRLIELINSAFQKTLDPNNIFLEVSDESTNVYFSFKKCADATNLSKLNIKKEKGNIIAAKLESILRQRKLLTIDLSESNSLEYDFSTDYRSLIGVLGFAIKSRKVLFEPANGSSVYLSLPAITPNLKS